jgi:hypothetical protein
MGKLSFVPASWSPEECERREKRASRLLAAIVLKCVDQHPEIWHNNKEASRHDESGHGGPKHEFSLST